MRALSLLALAALAAGCSSHLGSGASADDATTATPSPTATSSIHWTDAGYSVAPGSEQYHCWMVNVPVGGSSSNPIGATRFAYHSQSGVMHHLVVFTSTNAEPDGDRACDAMETGWTVRYAGGLNTDPLQTPSGVAVALAPTTTFVFQIHLLNASPNTVADDTTVDIDTLPAGTPFTHAGVILSGVSIFTVPPETSGWTTTGTCDWLLTDVSIYALFPHMHRHGTHFHIEQTKPLAAAPTTLLDEGWNFGNQALFPQSPELTLGMGDSIHTTCTFDNTTTNPVDHGESSDQEMCFDFFFYYPASTDAMLPCLQS